MALYYYKTKKTLWVKGEKKEKYVARQRVQGTLTEDDIAEELTKALSMEAPEVLLAMDELTDQIIKAMLRGQTIKVEGLGTFTPSLKTKSSDAPEEVNADAIQRVNINFRPDVKLKRMMDDVELKYYSQFETEHI